MRTAGRGRHPARCQSDAQVRPHREWGTPKACCPGGSREDREVWPLPVPSERQAKPHRDRHLGGRGRRGGLPGGHDSCGRRQEMGVSRACPGGRCGCFRTDTLSVKGPEQLLPLPARDPQSWPQARAGAPAAIHSFGDQPAQEEPENKGHTGP